jgi:hypothetical protein
MKIIIKSIMIVLIFPALVFASSSNWGTLVWNQDNWHLLSETGTVEGTVLASFLGYNDLKVANAAVSLSGTLLSTTTDANGHFSFSGVAPGTYTVTISADNLGTISAGLSVTAGSIAIASLAPMSVVCTGFYTHDDLEQAVLNERLRWDAGADNEIGLPDAIRALQAVSGMRE